VLRSLSKQQKSSQALTMLIIIFVSAVICWNWLARVSPNLITLANHIHADRSTAARCEILLQCFESRWPQNHYVCCRVMQKRRECQSGGRPCHSLGPTQLLDSLKQSCARASSCATGLANVMVPGHNREICNSVCFRVRIFMSLSQGGSMSP
jgi:hypothetical protein